MLKKQDILDELRRTAVENGGVPLGSEKFVKETVIKKHEWQKYWSKFSDALREAGLPPNSFQVAYSQEFLLKKLIDLIKELGKFPATGDLRVKENNDPDFPSQDTFFRRLGAKKHWAAEITNYSRKMGYTDIIELCLPALESQGTKLSSEDRIEKEQIGSVYMLKSGRYYKIGHTNDDGRRRYELKIQLPEKAEIVHSIKTDDPNGVEAYWHKRLKTKRKNGEWFDLAPSDLKAFKRWKRII